jgi:hypothetical protein
MARVLDIKFTSIIIIGGALTVPQVKNQVETGKTGGKPLFWTPAAFPEDAAGQKRVDNNPFFVPFGKKAFIQARTSLPGRSGGGSAEPVPPRSSVGAA